MHGTLYRHATIANAYVYQDADGAICELLAYYGGPDRERIERLWLRSGLGARDKVGRTDYRKRTIDLALRGKTRFHRTVSRRPLASDRGGMGQRPKPRRHENRISTAPCYTGYEA